MTSVNNNSFKSLVDNNIIHYQIQNWRLLSPSDFIVTSAALVTDV
jgi:hypothetical protein